MYKVGSIEYGGELFHHGIKGMKWGVRRTPEQLGHRTTNKSVASKTSGPTRKKIRIESASDEALKNAIDRKKRENDYRAEVLRTKEIKDKYKNTAGKDQRKSAVRIAKINANKNYKQAVATAFVNNILGASVKGVFDLGGSAIKGVSDIGKEAVKSFFDSKW